jgi:hypothetical protein
MSEETDDLANGILDVLRADPPKRPSDILDALSHVVGFVLYLAATNPNAPCADFDTGLVEIEGHFADAVHTVVLRHRAAAD